MLILPCKKTKGENKMKKAIIVSCLSLSIFGGSVGVNNVNAEGLTLTNEQESKTTEVRPLVNWSGDAYITTTGFSNVTTSNNFFNDSPRVTNASGNAGAIEVKIVDESSGAQIGKTYTIEKGKTVQMDKIAWNTGTYTLKAKAVSKNGTYTISIN